MRSRKEWILILFEIYILFSLLPGKPKLVSKNGIKLATELGNYTPKAKFFEIAFDDDDLVGI